MCKNYDRGLISLTYKKFLQTNKKKKITQFRYR